jgi:polyferredoxin
MVIYLNNCSGQYWSLACARNSRLEISMRPLFPGLADVILVLHAIVVLFCVGAVPVIWFGYFRGWAFVRNFYFRIVHLLLIGVVAAESVLGIVCPLTTWEDALRSSNGTGQLYQNGFIAHWLHELLFYDFPAWIFTVAYLLFFFLVAFTVYFVRPQPPRFRRSI